MKNTLALLAAVVLIVLVLGYFLNWYSFVGIESQGGSHRLQIDVNTSKIKSDIEKGKEKLKDAFKDLKDESQDPDVPAKLPAGPDAGSNEKLFRF